MMKKSNLRILVCAAILIAAGAWREAAAQQDGEGLKIPPEVAPFVEKATKPIALETADLDGDGTEDFVLVLESLKEAAEGEDEGRRSLLILTRGAGGRLSLAARNDAGLVYCRACGGIFGDPFAGVEAGAKTFTVSHYGGSNWRWTAEYKFNYSRIDRAWQLVRVEKTSFHVFEPKKIETEIYTPPKSFGKINLADFDPETLREKAAQRESKGKKRE